MATKREEIIVVGAGLIGLCTAMMLGRLKFNVFLIDKNNIYSSKYMNKDSRTIAVSYGTKVLLEKHGIWKSISPYVQPINIIKVFNRSPSSQILFDTKHKNNPMGYIVKNSIFKKVLISKIKKHKNIKIIQENRIVKTYHDNNHVYISTDKNLVLGAKVLIAADGKNSFIKSECNIPQYFFDYNQTSLTVNFQHQNNHNNTAYEIFLQNGPLATLPMKSSKQNQFRSSLIWTENNLIMNNYKKLKQKDLLKLIENKVSPYLGNIIKFENFKTFPLTAHICRRFYANRVVLIGDAAHSIHPIAGQGWNLGMRDIKYLIKILLEYKKIGIDIGNFEVLKKYNDARYADISSMFFITHNLNKLFSTRSKIVNKFTSLGFNYINKNRKLTKKLVNYAMGINL